MLKITIDDIDYAEKILLGGGLHFDKERKDFIKNLDTIDLQAVPGSGKTTALLAKLLILEKYLPLNDGSGVLVLSHTNSAVDEIKNRIEQFCPKLFSYPNFVGTIQSFVDQFLAIPLYVYGYKKKPIMIDTDVFKDRFSSEYPINLRVALKKRLGNNFDKYITEIEVNNEGELIDFSSGIAKPIPNVSNTTETYKKMVESKKALIKKGFLNFNDSYYLANRYLLKFPRVKCLLRKRFKYVFVDEMQDMEKYQYDLLESLFFCNEVVYQRIGDKNQAIFSNNKITLDKVWKDRETVLPLLGSYRLSPQIAKIVQSFALEKADIEGRGKSLIDPHMIVFSEETIGNVLPKFTQLVKDTISEEILTQSKYPIACVGWRKEPGEGKLGLKNYFNDFDSNIVGNKISRRCLRDHLSFLEADSDKNGVIGAIRKSLLEAFVLILRKENILQLNGRYFNESSLWNYLRDKKKGFYEDFKLKLYLWCLGVCRSRDNVDEVFTEIQEFIPKLLEVFGKETTDKSSNFINSEGSDGSKDERRKPKAHNENIYECESTGLKVEVGTVHSVKGKTNLATLYVETYYRKKYESNRLAQCFCNEKLIKFSNKSEKESSRIAYVAMSRPTQLLCFAIHRDRFAKIKEKVEGWKIEDLGTS